MRRRLLQALDDASLQALEITNAWLITHDLDWLFFQAQVLPRIEALGAPRIVVLADGERAMGSFIDQQPFLDGRLGSRYRVVPVHLDNPWQRFHPKALLLSGRAGARLWLGSGNLTCGGYEQNAELWVELDAARSADRGAYAGFYGQLARIAEGLPDADLLEELLAETFDGTTRDWANDLIDDGRLVATPGHGPGVVESILAGARQREVSHLHIGSPYFDAEAAGVRALIEGLAPAEVTLYLPASAPAIARSAIDALPRKPSLQGVRFRQASGREAFPHAKWYALEFDDSPDVTLWLGSANATRAGLLAPGGLGNAECLYRVDLPAEDFASGILAELGELDPLAASELPHFLSAEAIDPIEPRLVPISAEWAEGWLVVRIQGSGGPQWLVIRDEALAVTHIAPDVLTASCTERPDWVRVAYLDAAGNRQESAPLWVHDTEALALHSPARLLSRRFRLAEEEMAAGAGLSAALYRLLDPLLAYIDYTPASRTAGARSPEGVPSGGSAASAPAVEGDPFNAPWLPRRLRRSAGARNLILDDGILALVARGLADVARDAESRPGVRRERTADTLEGWPEAQSDQAVPDAGKAGGEREESPGDGRSTEDRFREKRRAEVERLLLAATTRLTDQAHLDACPPEKLSSELGALLSLLVVFEALGDLDAERFQAHSEALFARLLLPDKRGAGALGDLEVANPGHFDAMARAGLVTAFQAWLMRVVEITGDEPGHELRFAAAETLIRYAPLIGSVGDIDPNHLGLLLEAMPSGRADGQDEDLGERARAAMAALDELGSWLERIRRRLSEEAESIEAIRGELPELPAGTWVWQGTALLPAVLDEPLNAINRGRALALRRPGGSVVRKVESFALFPVEVMAVALAR